MNALTPEKGRGQKAVAKSADVGMSPRLQVLRNVAVFQVKLAADGLRDLILRPVSIIAGVIGLALGGQQAQLPFQQLLRLGRRTERWIDLFGGHEASSRGDSESNLDSIAAKVEDLIRQDYERGGISAVTRAHIDELLKKIDRQQNQKSAARRQAP